MGPRLCERLRRTTLQVSEVALLDLPVRLAKAVLRFTSAERHPENGKATDQIQSVCADASSVGSPLATVQRRTVLSQLALTSVSPSGEKARARTR